MEEQLVVKPKKFEDVLGYNAPEINRVCILRMES